MCLENYDEDNLNNGKKWVLLCLYRHKKKGAKEQWVKLKSEKAFVKKKECGWRQHKDHMGGETCWSSTQKLRMRRSLVNLSGLVKSVMEMVRGCLKQTKVTESYASIA